jgi:hypothetical protein
MFYRNTAPPTNQTAFSFETYRRTLVFLDQDRCNEVTCAGICVRLRTIAAIIYVLTLMVMSVPTTSATDLHLDLNGERAPDMQAWTAIRGMNIIIIEGGLREFQSACAGFQDACCKYLAEPAG